MTRNTMITAAVEKYVGAHTRETPLAVELRKETMRLPNGQMMTPPEVAALLGLLVRIAGAKRRSQPRCAGRRCGCPTGR